MLVWMVAVGISRFLRGIFQEAEDSRAAAANAIRSTLPLLVIVAVVVTLIGTSALLRAR
jgi:hypothetical protein